MTTSWPPLPSVKAPQRDHLDRRRCQRSEVYALDGWAIRPLLHAYGSAGTKKLHGRRDRRNGARFLDLWFAGPAGTLEDRDARESGKAPCPATPRAVGRRCEAPRRGIVAVPEEDGPPLLRAGFAGAYLEGERRNTLAAFASSTAEVSETTTLVLELLGKCRT